jgi:hypothetical protein
LAGKRKKKLVGKRLTAEDVEQKRNYGRNYDAGCQREVEGEVFPLYIDVSREMPEPWQIAGEHKYASSSGNDKPQDDEGLAELRHF